MQNKQFLTEDELVDFGWNDIEPKLPKQSKRPVFIWIFLGLLGISSLIYFNRSKDVKQSNSADVSTVPTENFEHQQATSIDEAEANLNSVSAKDQFPEKAQTQIESSITYVTAKKTNNPITSYNPLNKLQEPIVQSSSIQYQTSFHNSSTLTDAPIEYSYLFEKMIQTKENSVVQNTESPNLNTIQKNTKQEITKTKETSSEEMINSTKPNQVEIVNQIITTVEQKVAKPKTRYPFVDLHGQTNRFQTINLGIGAGHFWSVSQQSGVEVSANVRYGNEVLDQFAKKSYLDTTRLNLKNKWSNLQVNVPIKYSYQLNEKVRLSAGLSNDLNVIKNPNPVISNDFSGIPPLTDQLAPGDLDKKLTQYSITPTVGMGINVKSLRIDLEADGFGYAVSQSDTLMNYRPNIIRLGVTMPIKPKR